MFFSCLYSSRVYIFPCVCPFVQMFLLCACLFYVHIACLSARMSSVSMSPPCVYPSVYMPPPCICFLHAHVPSYVCCCVCMSLSPHVCTLSLQFYVLSVCMSLPCICPLRVYVSSASMYLRMYAPSVCMSPPRVCPSVCVSLRVYVPSVRMSLCVCVPSVCMSPLCVPCVCMSLRAYVPSCVYMLLVHACIMRDGPTEMHERLTRSHQNIHLDESPAGSFCFLFSLYESMYVTTHRIIMNIIALHQYIPPPCVYPFVCMSLGVYVPSYVPSMCMFSPCVSFICMSLPRVYVLLLYTILCVLFLSP